MIDQRIVKEAIARRKQEEEQAWVEFVESVDCNKASGECWCPVCDPQSYGGIGPHFEPLLVSVTYTCSGCDVEMGQVRVNSEGLTFCPRCNAKV